MRDLSAVTRTQAEFGSCSACARISAATKLGFALESAIIPISDGPAGKSISALSRRSILAAVTKTLPGPTILSTFFMDSVPSARAAIACAPPTRYISDTPAISNATMVSGFIGGGEQAHISLTPATRAGTAVMSAVDG